MTASILEGGIDDGPGFAARLRTGKATDEKLADGLLAADAATDATERLDLYRAVFFTAKDEPKAEEAPKAEATEAPAENAEAETKAEAEETAEAKAEDTAAEKKDES